MSVFSYTDVCFINVAAEIIFFSPPPSLHCTAGGGGGEVLATSVICTRCHNGQVYRGGRCVGRCPRGRCGD